VSIDGGGDDATNDTTPTISGLTNAADGLVMTVKVGVQTTTATVSGGQWSVAFTGSELADGIYGVRASVTSNGVVVSDTQLLTIDTVDPEVPTPVSPVVGTDTTPVISGEDCEPGSTVVVTIATQTLTTECDGDGKWSVTVEIPLAPGVYFATVTITDLAGNSASYTVMVIVEDPVNPVGNGGSTDGFNSVGPVRVFDTRVGQSPDALRTVTKQQVGGGYELEVQMTDLDGFVQSDGVGAVSLNVVSTGSGAAGYITVYACGTRDLVASVNFPAGATVGNAVITPVSADGTVCFFSSQPSDIVVDMNGWIAEGEAFNSVGPKRVFDTRAGESPDALRDVGSAKLAADSMMEVRVTDLGNGLVPGSGVGAVSLNVVATQPDADGFISVYSCGTRALVSNVNFSVGATVGNAVIAPVSSSGTVCFYSSATTDLVVDINGWFVAGAAFTAIGPKRVFDTRAGESPDAVRNVASTKLGANTMMEVKLTDLAGYIPGTGVGAVSLNVAVTGPGADGFITVYPCGTRNVVASLNFAAGETVGNSVIAPVSSTGTVCFYSSATTDLIVDINGWFAS